MLSKSITDLLSINYRGLFDDHDHCFTLLAAKRDSGDADTPSELTSGPLFDLSPELFIWVAEKHVENKSAHLVVRDIMSNISTAGLAGSYGLIVDMLADAGYQERAAQIWRADVASHIDVAREFGRAKKSVERYEALPEAKRPKAAPNRFQRSMAQDYPAKQKRAVEAVAAFEGWSSRYGIAERHKVQIDIWTSELEGTTKPKLPAAEKAPMSDALFWEIIEQAQSGSESETVLNVEDRLMTFTAKAIRDAAKLLQGYLCDAYREDVWALAYVLQDGCSDDAFEEFRNWLILRGKKVFAGTLEKPDMFEPRLSFGADFGAAGNLMSAFENAYLTRAGKPLTLPKAKRPDIELNEDRFAGLVPTLSARVA